jgi:hypothetical protein
MSAEFGSGSDPPPPLASPKLLQRFNGLLVEGSVECDRNEFSGMLKCMIEIGKNEKEDGHNLFVTFAHTDRLLSRHGFDAVRMEIDPRWSIR